MKNKILRSTYLLTTFFGLLLVSYSCESLRDTYNDFVGDGERVYVGKLDSVRVFSGYERVMVEGLMHYARTAKTVVVEWTGRDGKVYQKVDELSGYSKWDTLKMNISGMDEGITRFFVYTQDASGNRSVSDEAFVDVYGPNFLLTQSSRSIKSINLDENYSIVIEWNDPEYYVVDTKLSYTNTSGTVESMMISRRDKKSKIDNWKRGSMLEAVTRIRPKETDLDIMQLEKVSYQTPIVEGPVDTSPFAYSAVDPHNTSESDWGGTKGALFDGDESNFIHANGVGVPHHFSYDMGSLMTLSKCRMLCRADGVWKVYKYQIWGLPDFEGKITSGQYPSIKDNFANRSVWEDNAREKGWVLLGESPGVDPLSNNPSRQTTTKFDNTYSVRHIMYRVIKIGNNEDGDDKYSSTSEMYFWKLVE